MWNKYIKDKVPIDTPLLLEVENKNGKKEYHTGIFASNSTGGRLGRVGGHFDFDFHAITQYRLLEDLLP